MKNWKTTLAGIVAGLPIAIDAIMQAYTAGYFTDKSGWQLAASIAFIILGAVLRDKKIDSKNKEDVQDFIGTPNVPKNK